MFVTTTPTSIIPCSADAIAENKRSLRKLTIARRDAMAPVERERFAERITAQLLTMNAYQQAQTVMSYMSFGSEFETASFVLQVLNAGKCLVMPRVDKLARKLVLYQVEDLRDLETGVWGIREPRIDSPLVSLNEIDFLLMPGVAFDRTGNRLGYGAGFYDRLLADTPVTIQPQTLAATRVAAVFSLQVVDIVPTTENDQRVDFIMTENEQIDIVYDR